MRLKPVFFVSAFLMIVVSTGCESLPQGFGGGQDGLSSSSNSTSNSATGQGSGEGNAVRASTEGTPAMASSSGVSKAKFKKTIAVSQFEQKAGIAAHFKVGYGMADQLADALVQSGNFVVLERQTLGDVLGEQDLAASGRMAKSKTAQIGKIVPAQILIKGTVTEFENKTSGSDTGFSFGGVKIGSKAEEAHVGVILRIIDTTTGEILASERVEGKAKSGGTSFGIHKGGIGFGTDGFVKTPLGKATQIAIDRAVVQIGNSLNPIPFEGRVIKVSEGSIITNMGERNGISAGDTFTVFSPGEDILDPVTGENLGSEKTKVGTIEIVSVQEKFSKAVSKTEKPIEQGFILKE